jgi:hypothetical protein
MDMTWRQHDYQPPVLDLTSSEPSHRSRGSGNNIERHNPSQQYRPHTEHTSPIQARNPPFKITFKEPARVNGWFAL